MEAASHEAVCNFGGAGVDISIVSPFSAHMRTKSAVTFRPFQPSLISEFGKLLHEQHLSSPARQFRDFVIDHFRRLAEGETDITA